MRHFQNASQHIRRHRPRQEPPHITPSLHDAEEHVAFGGREGRRMLIGIEIHTVRRRHDENTAKKPLEVPQAYAPGARNSSRAKLFDLPDWSDFFTSSETS